ncbi:hypothetical protein [Streptomyces sp. NPDC004266]|uniref:hypothetical protein n=1 Tax=Streptomyces sp. NPDC004266 TaxID=3364693 RepID=UPI00369E97DC
MNRRPSSTHRPSVSRPGSSGLRFGMFAVCVSRDSDPGLNSGKAKPLYDLLVSYADVSSRNTGQGYPYREALASCLDCSKQTVDRAADYLEKEIGLVTVHRRKVEGKPEENDANLYELHDAWLIHGMTPPPGTPPQLVARYGHTVPGLDVAAWVAEHAPAFDLPAWQTAYEATLRAQETKREEQRRKERARRKKAKKGGGVTHDATPQDGQTGGGGVMGDATGGVTHDATGGVMGDALVYSPVVQSQDQEPPSPSVRPSVQVEDAHAKTMDGRTDGGSGRIEGQEHRPVTPSGEQAAADTAPGNGSSNEGDGAGPGRSSAGRPVDLTPGVEVLRAVAAEAPEWQITHAQSLRDQGRTATGMLDAGFTPQEIRHALLSRPLPHPLKTTVAGVVSGRLRDLIAVGPCAGVAPIPAQQAGEYDLTRPRTEGRDEGPTSLPASWADRRAQMDAEDAGLGRYRPCAGDSGICPHDALPGQDLCASCLGGERPTCAHGCGRGVVAPGSACIVCAEVPAASEIGDCPGYGGKTCGRAVQTAGLCGRCKIDAERDKAAAEAEWEAARDAAVAAAQSAEPEPASF